MERRHKQWWRNSLLTAEPKYCAPCAASGERNPSCGDCTLKCQNSTYDFDTGEPLCCDQELAFVCFHAQPKDGEGNFPPHSSAPHVQGMHRVMARGPRGTCHPGVFSLRSKRRVTLSNIR